MINPTGKKLEKLLFGIFDEAIQGVDTYKHDGSIWLIFTDNKKWVLEYTKEQNLWYNYYFFKQEMDMVGLDCVENKDLIQKWFESRFLNINPIEDTIQNGVKNTFNERDDSPSYIEDTIQNGVKKIGVKWMMISASVEDTIQNGVKKIRTVFRGRAQSVEDTIQNGVKKIRWNGELGTHLCEDVIENGKNYLNHKSIDL